MLLRHWRGSFVALIVLHFIGTSDSLQPHQHLPTTPTSPPLVGASRRSVLTFGLASTVLIVSGRNALADEIDEKAPLRLVKVVFKGPGDSLGLQLYNTQLRGEPAVAIQRVLSDKNPKLQPGMILKGYSTASELVNKLGSGPFPVELDFINLAAGGDAISDLGTSIVTPQDALKLAQKTDEPSATSDTRGQFSITTLQSAPGPCKIQSRRGDVLEFNYEARYVTPDGNRRILYDASSFRGTGRPYQMVLGSGDVIPGVDQGLYDMCPGEVRKLQIPLSLAYGPRARDNFRIPLDYKGLEWQVELVSIEGTIRSDNNDVTRQEREGRAPY